MSITSSMYFLSPMPLYNREKPYRLKFEPPSGLPDSNIEVEKHEVSIKDIRHQERHYTLEENGFALIHLESAMTYEDFNDETKIDKVYLKEIAESLKSSLHACRVQIFEHLVRKRHTNFPFAAGEEWLYKQPTTVAHMDMSREWAATMGRRLNHKIGLGNLPSQKYQYINVWKPLRGPVQDWPLALCDPRTVDPASLQDGDVVFKDFVIENKLLQYKTENKWYYVSNQRADEIWVFMQADSRDDGLCGVPHTSFLHPESGESTFPRESIEVRAIVYFDE